MRIDLERTTVPEKLGGVATCAICAGSFEMGVVDAMLVVDDALHGSVCPACVAFMGRHRSGKFPAIEEYRRLEATWGTPLYASRAEAERALGYPS